MKFLNRAISVILMLSVLLSVFVFSGCADTASGGSDEKTAAESIEPEATDMKSLRSKVEDGLPVKDYDAADFVMMIRNGWNDSYFMEEQTGDVVDDAVYERNLAVETRFDVNFEVFPVQGGWNEQAEFLGAIRSSVLADDDAFDAIEGYAAYLATFASEKLFGNWLDMAYTDVDKPWWSQDCADEFTINNKLFFITGDLSLSLWANFFVILFNKTLVTDFGFPDMYEIARSGNWTLDKLKELVEGVNRDLDGNSKLDGSDMYGFAISRGNYMDALHIIFDKPLTVRDETGIPALNIMSEEMVTLSDSVIDLLYNNTGVYSIAESGTSDGELRDMFVQNQIVLSPQYLNSVEIFRDKDTDFGIIPYPKFDENQTAYRTASQDSYAIFCFPITVNDLERCSIIMEAMAAESYKKVIPAYYEVALKTKYSRDDQSAEMLDLIRDHLAFNFGSINSANINGPAQIIRSVVGSSKGNYARAAKAAQKGITIKLDKLLEAYLG